MHRRWRCIFDLRPKRNPAPSGAAFFYPRRYAAAPCREVPTQLVDLFQDKTGRTRRFNIALQHWKHKKRMADRPSFTVAPRLRGGCLPFGEARGGVFALSELPHPCHVLLSRYKGNTFSFICKMQLYPKRKNRLLQGVILLHHPTV